MKRKGSLIIMLLFMNMLIPFVLIFSTDVSASWLGDSHPLTRPTSTLDFTHPSIASNSTGGLFFTYIQHVYLNDDHELYLGNNSNGYDHLIGYDIDDLCFTDGDGISDPKYNTSYNSNCEIAISNDVVHIVWQGIAYSDSEYDIFYTNNSGGDLYANIIRVTPDDGVNVIDPSITVVNGTVFIAYRTAAVTDVRLVSSMGGSWFGTPVDPLAGNGNYPKLSSWSNSTFWRVDLAYIDSSNDMPYLYLNSTDTQLSDIHYVGTATGPFSEVAIASGQNMAAFCMVDGDTDIWAAKSTDITNPVAVTSNLITEGVPDVVVNDNDLITIFFVRNITSTHSVIASADNYNSNFAEVEYLIDQDQVPLSGNQLAISGFDACLIPGEGVALIYDAKIPNHLTNPEQKLYLSAYGNLYNDGTGDYNYYSWDEDLGGFIYSEGWVIEGIEFSYNTSSSSSIDLMVQLTDTVTNETWYNISSFPGSGGNYYKKLFFQPGNYFIARNPFRVDLLNGSSSQDLLKIEIDPLDFASNYNYTSDYDNDTFAYTIQDENVGSGFEFTVFYFDKTLGKLDRAATKLTPQAAGTFNTNNYVDLYKFDMKTGEQYNMSLTVTGTGINNCRLLIFNSTPQITSTANAEVVRVIDSGTNGAYFQLYATQNELYYVVIENLDYSKSYSYTFRYKVCPMIAKLINPSNYEFLLNFNVNFQWALNTLENSGGPDLSILRYELKIFEDSDLVTPKITYLVAHPQQNKTIIIVNGPYYNLPDGSYYMNVTIVTNDFQKSKPSTLLFHIDTHNPNPPIIYAPPIGYYYTFGQFVVSWSIPSDGEFSVKYFEFYSGESRDFPCDSAHRYGLDLTSNQTTFIAPDPFESNSYYFKVIAVDNVEKRSIPSEAAKFVVAVGAFVDSDGQNFSVHVGDMLEYRVVDIIDSNNHDPNTLTAVFMRHTFYLNTMLLYYVTDVNDEATPPVEGTWYMKWNNITAQQLNVEYQKISSGKDFRPIITTSDPNYQKEITELFILWELDLNTIQEVRDLFEYNQKKTLYFGPFMTTEAVVHTYYQAIDYNQEELGQISFRYDSFIFVYDANTGVLIEMTLYNYDTDKGFSLRLENTNIGLSYFPWWLIPLIIGTTLGIIAAIINQIVKRQERRI